MRFVSGESSAENRSTSPLARSAPIAMSMAALFGLAVAIVVGRLPQPTAVRPRKPRIFRSADTTRRIAVGGPKIYRGAEDSAEHTDPEAPPDQGSSNGS